MNISKEIIQKAMDFDMTDVVERYSEDNEIPLEVAKEHEIELKRFLALCSINPQKPYGMAGVVDELWHTFIFHTKDYLQFCSEVNGNFIHHIPEKKTDKRNPKPYLDMLSDYEIFFGLKAPSHIWPDITVVNSKGAGCSHGGGNSCSRCGHGCSSCGHGCRGCTRCSTG